MPRSLPKCQDPSSAAAVMRIIWKRRVAHLDAAFRTRLLTSGLALAVLGVQTGSAQVLRGRVVEADGGAPVAAARVALAVSGDTVTSSALTDAEGAFVLPAPAPGRYLIEVTRLGYAPQHQGPIAVGEGKAAQVEVYLRPLPYRLDSVTVTADATSRFLERVGWYARQRSSFGHFLAREEIERRHANRMTDLLTGIPGVRLVSDGRVPGSVRIQMRGSQLAVGGVCEPRVVVDGVIAIRGDSRPVVRAGKAKGGEREDPLEENPRNPEPSLNEVADPRDVEGIEAYRSTAQVPAEFGGGGFTLCGVLVIWTRRGR